MPKKIKSVPADKKPRTSLHRSPGGETGGERKHSSISFETTTKGHRQFSSVQFKMASRRSKSAYAFHPDSQKLPQSGPSNSSSVCLTDDGPLSSFQGRPSSASSFHASLLQVIDGVMPLALCPQVSLMSEATQTPSVRQTDWGFLGTKMPF